MSEDNRRRGSSLRASDEDRERFAEQLRAHAVAGRLTTDELEERLQLGYRARTLGELDELRADLPETQEALAVTERDRRGRLVRRTVQETGGSLGAFAVCTVIWIASGADSFFWPIFVALGVLGLLVRNTWDLFGPAADLDAVEARLDARRHGKSQRHDGGYDELGRPRRHGGRERRRDRG